MVMKFHFFGFSGCVVFMRYKLGKFALCQKAFVCYPRLKVQEVLADAPIKVEVALHLVVVTVDAHAVKPRPVRCASLSIHKGGRIAFQESVNRGHYGCQNLFRVAVVGDGKVVNSSGFGMLVSKSEVVNVGGCGALKLDEFANGTFWPFTDEFKTGELLFRFELVLAKLHSRRNVCTKVPERYLSKTLGCGLD